MAEDSFVVTRPYPDSGIGSNLVSFAGAVWLAGRLGRGVVVDWRGSAFLRDKDANLFTEFLEPVEEIQGVRVRYAKSPREPWDEKPGIEPSGVGRLLASGSDDRFVVLTPFHSYDRIEPGGDPFEQFRRLRHFLSSIRPRDFLRREIESFAAEHRLNDTFAVAVNIATGNGDYRKGSPFYGRVKVELFERQPRFLRKIARARADAIRRLPRAVRDRALTFVATDAAFMRELLLELPNAVTRRSVFPPPGAGRGFTDYDVPGYTDRDAFADILIDHFLLARCNAIVRNPSMFATYALVTTNFFNGNIRNVESMYPGYLARAALRRLR